MIERHQRDVGGTDEQVAQRMGMLTALAKKAGLTYRLDLARAVEEGAIVSDFDTLVRLGVECGLDAEATREALARRVGVTGVPTFVFNGQAGDS